MTIEIHRARATTADPAAEQLLLVLQTHAAKWKLDESLVYYGFPRFRDEDDDLIIPRVLVLSPHHGLRLFGTIAAEGPQTASISQAKTATELVFGQLYGKLIANRSLRGKPTQLAIPAQAYLYVPGQTTSEPPDPDIPTIGSDADLAAVFKAPSPIPSALFAQLTATVDGSRVIPRPKKRESAEHLPASSKGGLVAQLEMELACFDKKQREASVTDISGPQRIRGLAGSGKTIVLSKKAALTHLDYPKARIAYTFHTKSLYQQIRRLITRFYRDEHDRDPNWDTVTVAHSWGGADPGIYSLACSAHGAQPMNFAYAERQSGGAAFEYACSELLNKVSIRPMYDYLFVDEGQDYPDSFLRLCSKLATNMQFVYAYDELQTIFQPTAPTPATIFGVEDDGSPRVHLERDTVLYKCYRNPREILVCAHAVGFGIYGKMVQMLENEEHWNDVGYVLTGGQLRPGDKVELLRPAENSLGTLSEKQTIDELVSAASYDSFDEEVAATVRSIRQDLKDGLRPDDIVVTVVDDRNAKAYLGLIATKLQNYSIRSNNIHGAMGLVDFQRDDHVTLTTVHKAKGNEGFVVYVVGASAASAVPGKQNRNKLFTAMTRAKGWLRVSGVGSAANALAKEIELAKRNFPSLRFVYPKKSDLAIMKRDLDDEAVLSQEAERLLDKLSDDQLAFYLKQRRQPKKR